MKRKIQVLKQEPKFNEILKLKRLPPRQSEQQQGYQQGYQQGDQQAAAQESVQQVPAASQGADQQASTSADSSVPTPEEAARNAASKKVLDATYRPATKVFREQPPLMPGLRNVDIEFNQGYGYQNMEGIIRLIDYAAMNSGFVLLTTQQRGACMFHAFRRSISCPTEFTNSHLRRMLVSLICNRTEELYPMLVCSISGNYGHIRLTADEYRKSRIGIG